MPSTGASRNQVTPSSGEEPTPSSNGTKNDNGVSNPTTSNPSANNQITSNRSNGGDSTPTAENPNIIRPTKQHRVWAWPWVTFLIFLYIFILFWVNYAIVQRYWILHNWNDALPGLDKTALRKFTMRSHMTAGAVALLLGPIQFVPAFRRRPRLRGIHRWSGRIYCTCGMLSSLFGLWFIVLKKQLVGGYNMTVSFTLAGAAIGLTSFKAWQSARAARFGDDRLSKALFSQHRNWGIRSFAQIMAPALYRYWYAMMQMFHMYNVPVPLRMGGYCDTNDLCPDYARPWDSIYTWLYWLSAGVVAEIIIYFLPSHDHNIGERGSAMTEEDRQEEEEEAALVSPLLQSHPSTEQQREASSNTDNSTTTYGTSEQTRGSQNSIPYTPRLHTNDVVDGMPWVVNLVGGLLALAAIAITGKTFYVILATSSPDDTS